MIVKLTIAIRNSMGQVIIDALDAGTGGGFLRFFTGDQPAGPATAITTQTLLGTLLLSDPSATISDGILAFSSITQDSDADASGTASWCRLFDANNNAVSDFDITDGDGDGAVRLNTTAIVQHGPILMTSFTITMPGG